MTFGIGLRTVDRPQNYCAETLLRLQQTGTIYHPSVKGFYVSHGEGLTPNENGAKALRLAAQDNPDWVLFLEDDIDVIDDLIGSVERWLTAFAHQDILVYPLGCAYPSIVGQAAERGAWDYPIADTFYGTQALLFRTPDALAYAAWLLEIPEHVSRREICFDLWLAKWHLEQRPDQKFLRTPAPCFVDHLGEHSIMGDNKQSWERCGRFEAFGGRKFSYQTKATA